MPKPHKQPQNQLKNNLIVLTKTNLAQGNIGFQVGHDTYQVTASFDIIYKLESLFSEHFKYDSVKSLAFALQSLENFENLTVSIIKKIMVLILDNNNEQKTYDEHLLERDMVKNQLKYCGFIIFFCTYCVLGDEYGKKYLNI